MCMICKGVEAKWVVAVEELLRQVGVDDLVTAPILERLRVFGATVEYQQQGHSFFPDEELTPRYEGQEQYAVAEELLGPGPAGRIYCCWLSEPREGEICKRPGGQDRKFKEGVCNGLDPQTRMPPEVSLTAQMRGGKSSDSCSLQPPRSVLEWLCPVALAAIQCDLLRLPFLQLLVETAAFLLKEIVGAWYPKP